RYLFSAAVNQDQFESGGFKLGDLRDQSSAKFGVEQDTAAEFNYGSHQISKNPITFVEAERDVGVLQSLARRALEQIVERRDDYSLPGLFIHRATDVAERRVGDEFNLRHLLVENARERRIFKGRSPGA